MFRLTKWEALPAHMQCEEVHAYYDRLCRKKITLLFKRIFDLFVGTGMAVLLLPVMLIISVLIKLDSKGSVFFRQKRVTTNGKIFMILKFRTMISNAQNMGTQVTVHNDTRITNIGRILRKFRLDELPQVFNVIKGEMSFVGTRPEVKKYVDEYSPQMLATLLLPAGITSKASIQYKDEERILHHALNLDEVYLMQVLPEKMKYNLEYLEKIDLLYDLRIMLETVLAVLGKS